MKRGETLYFLKGGPQCTQATLEAAKARAVEIAPEAVIVTTSTGKTAVTAAQIFSGCAIRLIAVAFQKHLWDRLTPLDPELAAQSRALGVEFLPDTPIVPMLDDERPDIVQAWRNISQGFKVALQVAAMCVDTGLVTAGAHVISVGGSNHGADTAIAVNTQGTAAVLKSNVSEIIAMPSH